MQLYELGISVVLAYLLGSLPFGYWIGKVFYHRDLLKRGSGNIGTTNTFRILGTKAGTVVFILDVLKGTAGASVVYLFGPLTANQHFYVLLVGVFAILGHTFSPWLHFRGGKGVATSLGVLLAYSVSLFFISFAVFITGLFLFSIVSMSSMLTFLFSTIIFYWLDEKIVATVTGVVMLYVIYLHRQNIQRMINGTENTIKFGIPYWLGLTDTLKK